MQCHRECLVSIAMFRRSYFDDDVSVRSCTCVCRPRQSSSTSVASINAVFLVRKTIQENFRTCRSRFVHLVDSPGSKDQHSRKFNLCFKCSHTPVPLLCFASARSDRPHAGGEPSCGQGTHKCKRGWRDGAADSNVCPRGMNLQPGACAMACRHTGLLIVEAVANPRL